MTALTATVDVTAFLAKLTTLAVVGVSLAVPAASTLAAHLGR